MNLDGSVARLASTRTTAEQLMMVRTGAVVSGAPDKNARLNHDFLDCWDKLIDDGLAVREQPARCDL